MEFILGIMFTMSIIAVGMIFINLSKLNTLIEDITINKEIIETENEYYKGELKKLSEWKDFLPTPAPTDSSTPARKYNPDKIKGAFDGMFEADK